MEYAERQGQANDAALPGFDKLAEFLRIPSISADPDRRDDVAAAAEWVAEYLRGAGGEVEVVTERVSAPLVIGELEASVEHPEAAPTVLHYGHFDVQPVDPLELWESDPFEPVIRDGWIYARGASDDKGQLWMMLEAAATLKEEGNLPVNVKFLIDGEEEIGGSSASDYLRAHRDLADAAVIFDGQMLGPGEPVFVISVRGMIYAHVRVRSATGDLHSGIYGGVVHNALHVLLDVLDTVRPREGKVPDALNKGVVAARPEEVAQWRLDDLPSPATVIEASGGIPINDEAVEDFYDRTWSHPSVDIHGIVAGSPYVQKTVIPAVADANVSMRLAPDQDADEMAAEIEQLMRSAVPAGVKLDVEFFTAHGGALFPPEAEVIQLAIGVFERVASLRPLTLRCGGGLEVAETIGKLGIPLLACGWDVPEGNIHAPNERLLVDNYELGRVVARELLLEFSKLKTAAGANRAGR